MITSGLRLIYS